MRWLLAPLLLCGVLASAWLVVAEPPAEADFRFASALDVNTLDPQRMSWMHDFRIAELIYETLLRVKLPEMKLEPAAAERWERSADGLTYTFHLRPTAAWSNGDRLTAGDFIYGWRRLLLPESAADYSNFAFHIVGAEEFFQWRQEQLKAYGDDARTPAARRSAQAAAALWEQAERRFRETVGLSAPDPGTLVVRLKRPVAYFADLCAFAALAPVHSASAEKFVHLNADTGHRIQDGRWTQPEHLVCNGPYRLKQWRFKRDMLLAANERYWNRAAMGNASIRQVVYKNPSLALLAYERGEVDWLPDLPTTSAVAADLVPQGRKDVHTGGAAGTYHYIFNCQARLADGSPNPLHDARVRRALAMSIDRGLITGRITRLNQPQATTFVPVGSLNDYDPPAADGPQFDLEQARQLLAAAGHPGGRGLTGLSIIYNTEGGHGPIAETIQQGWEKNLGVSVRLEGVETRMFRERRKGKDYTVSRSSWYGDYRDPTTFLEMFRTGDGNNDAGYSNKEYDALLDQAAVELDATRRLAILRQAESLLLREAPLAPIYQYVNLDVFNPAKVEGLHLNAWHFRRLEFVKVKR